MNIAIIAHDVKKELMTQFCIAYAGILSQHNLAVIMLRAIVLGLRLIHSIKRSHQLSVRNIYFSE